MKRYLLLLMWVFVLFASSSAIAQVVDPFREYTNPDEIVTFDKNTSYSEAIEIINTFAQDYENKFIIDRSGFGGNLGVNLPPMYWKEALQYILRINNLQLNENEDFYEIVRQEAPAATQGGQAQSGGSGGGGGGGDQIATTQTQEVRINATFFEGNKRALKEIGIDWSTLTNQVPTNLDDFVAGEPSEGIPNTELDDQFVSVSSFNAASVSQNAFNALVNLPDLGTGISVQALFSAFEADNLGKVLATPSIKVVDGNVGNIQVGQDFSIKQRDIAGNVTDNFVNTGTILNVTPQIINQEDTTFIYLDLEVERSTAQPGAVSTVINKQEATTSAILLNGEATYVAGLYRTEEATVRRGVPILKDLPAWFLGLRYIFGYNSKDYTENELIIIVQAELVKPVAERIADRRKSKREILDNTRAMMRTDLDRVFQEEQPIPTVEEDTMAAKETEPDTTEQIVEVEPDTVVQDTTEAVPEEKPDDLTEEQQELAEELSMPVEHPELMVVVPKAFDLDQYLEYKEEGIEVEEETDLKYFVIGGSFIVQNNAYNFLSTLENAGYNARMLYNTKTRFHFIAYQGFRDFDTAVQNLRRIKENVNDEAWLFTIQAPNEQIKE